MTSDLLEKKESEKQDYKLTITLKVTLTYSLSLSPGQSLSLRDDHSGHLQTAALQGGHGHSGYQELATCP